MPNGQQVINMIEYLANNYADGDAKMVELILEDVESVALYVSSNETIQFTEEDESFFRSQGAFRTHSADEEDEENDERYSRVTVLYN